MFARGHAVLLLAFSPAPDCLDKKPRRHGFDAPERLPPSLPAPSQRPARFQEVAPGTSFPGDAPSHLGGTQGASAKRSRTPARGHFSWCARPNTSRFVAKTAMPLLNRPSVRSLPLFSTLSNSPLCFRPTADADKIPTGCLVEAAAVGNSTRLLIRSGDQADMSG